MILNYRFPLCLCLLALLCQTALAAKPKQKGLIPGSAADFRPNANEQIILYYDLNRDYKTDIVTKSLDRDNSESAVNFYIWNGARKQYAYSGSASIQNYVLLQTVMATSFKDSQFKLIFFYHDEEGTAKIVIRPFSCQNYICEVDKPLFMPEISAGLGTTLPTLLSLDGRISLMYQYHQQIKILFFNPDNSYEIKSLPEVVHGRVDPIGYQHSFVGDYDGDCQADLILLVKNENNYVLQFYRGDQYNVYSYSEMFIVQEDVRHFTVHDINFDGKNDLLLLLKSGEVQIHYNNNPNTQDLCVGVADPYDYRVSQHSVMHIQRVSLGGWSVSETAVLLFGDYNNDGYDDFSVTLVDPQTGYPRAMLFHNEPCTGEECGTFNPLFIQASSTLNTRTFTKQSIAGLGNVVTRISFIDIFEDGNLDFIAEVQKEDSKGRYLTIQPVYNNYGYDAFFLTITLLAPRNHLDLLMNTEYIGGCASFYVTLLSGELAPRTGIQMSQTGSTLQIPSIRFGLGRTNNYLESLTVHLPRKLDNEQLLSFEWSPIIPNSDILIVPPPSTAVANIADQWVLQVMIEPTSKMGPVVVLVVLALVIIGIAILKLSRQQKEEDKESQQSFYTLLS